MGKKLCFVVMGFGKKTDYSGAPRTLDLDATYQAIIKPAVEACGLECVRADEVTHSGIIDKPMYEMLLRADLVVADISTANPNALYELGVRHALRPFSTILIKEVDGKFQFDLNHLATLQYKHLGEDIGAREAATKQGELKRLIEGVLANPDLDSPVYTFLRGLNVPTMSATQYAYAVSDAKAHSDSLARALEEGRRAATESRSADARDQFQRAYDIQREARSVGNATGTNAQPDPYVIQQLALHTYKAKEKEPAEARIDALKAAWAIILQLGPASSTDPETLGIGGAIQKRLHGLTKSPVHLELAIDLYGRGFEVKRDYYNGENYATCLDRRAGSQPNASDADYDRKTARKVRERIVAGLEGDLADPHVKERSDYKWMVATMANTLRALGKSGDGYETEFRALAPAKWEIETFEQGQKYALELNAATAPAG